jgi:hypothetical protein
MFVRNPRVILLLICIAMAIFMALHVAGGATKTIRGEALSGDSNFQDSASVATATEIVSSHPRNLSLQPEIIDLSRRLGARFSPRQRGQSVLSGTLSMGTQRHVFQATRTQTEDGERVEILMEGSPRQLTWEREQGSSSSGARAVDQEREIIERIVFDSPDQLVLAQLRGAAYSVVARAVRPEGAADGYDGPLWDIVRIDDPEPEEAKQPESRWRLFYVNSRTGLVDRSVSEVRGERIIATFSNWTTSAGETFPSRIVWTRGAEVVMEAAVSNLMHMATSSTSR